MPPLTDVVPGIGDNYCTIDPREATVMSYLGEVVVEDLRLLQAPQKLPALRDGDAQLLTSGERRAERFLHKTCVCLCVIPSANQLTRECVLHPLDTDFTRLTFDFT